MPVSRTREVQARPRSSIRVQLDVDDHFALLGELDGVADQVDEHLAQPARVARDSRPGTSAAMWQASSRPLLCARRASVLMRIAERCRAG